MLGKDLIAEGQDPHAGSTLSGPCRTALYGFVALLLGGDSSLAVFGQCPAASHAAGARSDARQGAGGARSISALNGAQMFETWIRCWRLDFTRS